MKQFLLSTAAADNKEKDQHVTGIYNEETLEGSDFAKLAKGMKLYEAKTFTETIEGIGNEPTLVWVTTITRLS
jgi:hypothetical protein